MRFHRSRIIALTAVGSTLVGFVSCTHEVSKSETPSPSAPSVAIDEAAQAGAFLASAPLGRVIRRDAAGAARLIVGARETLAVAPSFAKESVAIAHLARHAELLGLTRAAVQDAVVTASHDLPGGGSIVQFKQRSHGIDVFQARASVVLDAAKNLVSLANGLVPTVMAKDTPKELPFQLPPEVAVAQAYAAQTGSLLPAGAVMDSGKVGDDARTYVIRSAEGSMRVIDSTARRVLFPEGRSLTAAYYVEILARAPGSDENQARGYVIAAKDGRILYDVSLTQNDAFTYRVWAESTGDHLFTDSPLVDYSPHPTGMPDKVLPAFQMPIMVTMESFKKKPAGMVDPWLPANAAYSWGNNVRAYSDRNNYMTDAGVNMCDGFDEGVDLRAEPTSAKTFDRIYDVTKAPESSSDQIKAAITQQFYVTNWLHDYWYDSGFDEKSGVAQLDNLGRGGVGNDPLRAEAQDSALAGQSNNANMSTPADGRSPRMQMYVWTGLPNRQITTVPAMTIVDGIGASGFGPQTFDVSGDVVLSNDGTPATPDPTMGTTSDACQVPINVSGKIAVIDRGLCAFTVKAMNAQTAGAIGIILVNNAPGHAPPNPGGVANVTVPLLGISLEEGMPLKQALAAGAVTGHLVRGVETQRDGTIDNTVVAHEWGHYLHHRLVSCGSQSCGGMSEGWADFDAVLHVIRDGDTFDNGKVYPLAQYAAGGLNINSAYFGIRRAPYSTDMTKNPFTFGHVRKMSKLPMGAPLAPASPDMSEVHNVGEIWTETLFEAYVNLLAAAKAATPARTFDETKRRMADYVVAGMKAAPNEPSFTEQRDALLQAVLAIPGRTDDFVALAKGFAKRGLGVGAEAPPTSSTTLDEATENFDFKGNLGFVDAVIDDSVKSCDHDGALDKGEAGKVTVKVQNTGWEKLTQTQVKVATTDPNVAFDNGGMATIASLDPYETKTVTIGVTAKDTVARRSLLPLTITLSDPGAFTATADTEITALFNFDDKQGISAIDDVESEKTAWTPGHGATPTRFPVWNRQGDATNHVWHGDDFGVESDESLVSPKLEVSPTNPFIISFSHRYSFETGPAVQGGPDVFFDGGVLEISEDDGATWNDVSKYADPNYPVSLFTDKPPPPDGGTEGGPKEAGAPDASGDSGEAGAPPTCTTGAGPAEAGADASTSEDTNLLAGRKAWGGESPGYPDYINVSLNLGNKLAGKTVKIRFRIGTDAGGGEAGWDIDNIAFGSTSFAGITNAPFSSLVDNSGICSDGGVGDGGPRDGATDAPAAQDAGKDAGKDAGYPPVTPQPEPDSGCGCRTPGHTPTGGAAAFVSMLGLLFAARRRRSRRGDA